MYAHYYFEPYYVSFSIALQIPLGIQLNDESQHDEMLLILERLQAFSPRKASCDNRSVCEGGNEVNLQGLLLGGDQFSTAMARRVITDRKNSMNEEQRLCGVIPVNEDWHTKLCFLTVCFFLPLNNNIHMLLIFMFFYP